MSETMYCPKCGNVDLVTLDDRTYECSGCGYQYFHNTAAATSAIIWHQGRIALITRAREPGEGLLDLPGGFVDSGESIEAAVVREAFEETGAVLSGPRFLFSVPNRYSHHTINYSTVDIFFEFEVDRRPTFIPNDEASGLSWLSPHEIEIEKLVFNSVKIAVQRLRSNRGSGSPAGSAP